MNVLVIATRRRGGSGSSGGANTLDGHFGTIELTGFAVGLDGVTSIAIRRCRKHGRGRPGLTGDANPVDFDDRIFGEIVPGKTNQGELNLI